MSVYRRSSSRQRDDRCSSAEPKRFRRSEAHHWARGVVRQSIEKCLELSPSERYALLARCALVLHVAVELKIRYMLTIERAGSPSARSRRRLEQEYERPIEVTDDAEVIVRLGAEIQERMLSIVQAGEPPEAELLGVLLVYGQLVERVLTRVRKARSESPLTPTSEARGTLIRPRYCRQSRPAGPDATSSLSVELLGFHNAPRNAWRWQACRLTVAAVRYV